jgi:hypothetical protein
MERLEELKSKLCKEVDEYAGLSQFDRNAIEHIDKLLASIHHINKIMDHDGTGMYGAPWRPEHNPGYGNDYYSRDWMTYGPSRDSAQYNAAPHYYGEKRATLVEKLEELKRTAPDAMIRNDIQKLIDKMQ